MQKPPNPKERRMMTMRRKRQRQKAAARKATMPAKQPPVMEMSGTGELRLPGGVAGLLTRQKVGIARSAGRARAMTTMIEESEKMKWRLLVVVPAATGSILKRGSAETTVAIEGPPRATLPVAVIAIVMTDAMMAEIAKTATAGLAVEVETTIGIGSVIGNEIVIEVEAMIGVGTIEALGLPRTMEVVAEAQLVAAPNKW
mmetsp:Transcript_18980/g.30825  ORF Transcript_18980/g.30825 Transcript_18980/m.30825 type:complete len:200 (+) Transcript_18980:1469-2068(+)